MRGHEGASRARPAVLSRPARDIANLGGCQRQAAPPQIDERIIAKDLGLASFDRFPDGDNVFFRDRALKHEFDESSLVIDELLNRHDGTAAPLKSQAR